jgi:tetratricopeptide (TPR) repeat protein
LLRGERRDLHARAARAIEAAASERLPEVAAILGRHYAAAEHAGRAVHYLELAGDHATDAFANDEAIASFREALAVTGHPGTELTAAAVQLHAKLANVLWRTAHRHEARAAFEAALRLAESGPEPLDPLVRARLHTRLGRIELTEARYDEAAAAFDAAEALTGDLSEPGRGGQASDAVVDQWLELMVDGRADMHIMRRDTDRALAVLEQARPVLEARGTPVRKTTFYRFAAVQKILRNGLRVDDEDLAGLRAGVAYAELAAEDKDLGYAADFLGWALWLRGDLTEATEVLTATLALAERVGETLLRDLVLMTLALTALRQHDTEAVRALLPRAFAAARHSSGGIMGAGRLAGSLAVAAWLAWQDGRPQEVIRLAAEVKQHEANLIGIDGMNQWVYLFPLLAARLQAGETAAAVEAARQAIDPSQQWLPDDLTAALAAACASWDRGDQARTAELLTEALAVARARAYF